MKSYALSAKKPRHIENECPLRRKNKKKAIKATWDDDSESESEEEAQEEIAKFHVHR